MFLKGAGLFISFYPNFVKYSTVVKQGMWQWFTYSMCFINDRPWYTFQDFENETAGKSFLNKGALKKHVL